MKFNPYSSSRLDVATCGYSFIREYGQKNRVKRESIPSARGSAAHEVLEKITLEILNGRSAFNPNEVRKWVVEAVNRHPAAYVELEDVLNIASTYINSPINFMWKDVRVEQNLAVRMLPEDALFTDQPITWDFCDYDDPRAFFRGRIDILMFSDDGDTAIIYDHKTQMNREDADTFQMGLYAWLVWKFYPHLKSISTVLHFARHGSCSSMYNWTPSDLTAIEQNLLAKVEAVETRTDFIATPHKNCGYCAHLTSCPEWREIIILNEAGGYTVRWDALKILGSTHKAVSIAGLCIILKAVLDRVERELEAHVSLTGPLAIPGVIYEFRKEQVIDYDSFNRSKTAKQEYVKLCQEHDVDPIDYMAVTATHSKGIWKTGKEALIMGLSKLFKRKDRVTFKGWKT